MSQWARLEGNVVVELVDFDPTGIFNPSLVWVACPPDVRAGWTYDGTTWAEPVSAPSPQTLKMSAQAALDASDITVLRCYEHGVAVPAEWQAYRDALRSVIAGTASTIPTRPAYPAGT